MSQYDFGDLESPLSGTALINTHLEPWRNALHSSHSGSSRPSYAAAGMMWVDNSGTPWILNMFDGTDDIPLGTINPSTNLFTPAVIGTLWCGTSGGTANAQTFTPSRAISAYATGQAYEGLINTTNTTAAPTVNISGIGAKTVKIYTSGGKVNLPKGALQGICRFVYDGTDLVLLNVRPFNKSADIATASTVNLDNATGDFVHLTGTTTVTAITLAEGREVTCVADSAFKITDGSGNSPQTIINPGAVDITTAAGDTFVVRGEDSGTVRIIAYNKADGTAAFYGLKQNSKSAAYTTVLSDANKHILHPSADTTARVFTIDSNANVPYPIGTTLTFVNQNSAGVITISITSDTMRLAGAGTTGSRTLAANGMATALKITSTEWIISGTGLT